MLVRGMWAAVSGFLLGVFLRSFLAYGWWTIFFYALLSIIPLLVRFAQRADVRPAVVAALFFLALAGGSARMQMAAFSGESALDVRVGERKVVIEGIVSDEPDARENSVRIPVSVTMVASTSVERSVKVLVVAPLHTDVGYGDRVRAEGALVVPQTFDTGLGRTFNYPAFLAKDNIGYQLSFASIEKTGDSRRNPLKAVALLIKHTYLEGLAMALPEPHAGLAGGITVGDKRGLGEELSSVFRTVGLIHIVVLSGYNIMIVISGIERFFGWTRLAVRSVVAGTVAILFAFMTGFASSSVRAASMALIATVGKATGRTYLASRALGVVAFFMVLWNPFILAFDPGFQLSILATLGLIYVSPLVAARMPFVTEKFGLREIIAATLGTQAAVLPLLLYQSGQFSLYTLPANLLALIAVPYAMAFSAAAGFFGTFLGPLAPIAGFPAYLLLWYVTAVANVFAALPFATLSIPAFGAGWLAAIYAALCALYGVIEKRAARPSRASPHRHV